MTRDCCSRWITSIEDSLFKQKELFVCRYQRKIRNIKRTLSKQPGTRKRRVIFLNYEKKEEKSEWFFHDAEKWSGIVAEEG